MFWQQELGNKEVLRSQIFQTYTGGIDLYMILKKETFTTAVSSLALYSLAAGIT